MVSLPRAARSKMNGVGFGSFSDDEVDKLYTNQTNKKPVEFICSKRPASYTSGTSHSLSSSSMPANSPEFHFSSPLLTGSSATDLVQFGSPSSSFSTPLAHTTIATPVSVSPSSSHMVKTPPSLSPSTTSVTNPSPSSTTSSSTNTSSVAQAPRTPSKLNVHAKEFVPQHKMSIISTGSQQQQKAISLPSVPPSSLPPPPPPLSPPLPPQPSSAADPTSLSSPPSSSPSHSAWPLPCPTQTSGRATPDAASTSPPLSDEPPPPLSLPPNTTTGTSDTSDPPPSCSSGYVSERGEDYQKVDSPIHQDERDAVVSPTREEETVKLSTLEHDQSTPTDTCRLLGEDIVPSSEYVTQEKQVQIVANSNQETNKEENSMCDRQSTSPVAVDEPAKATSPCSKEASTSQGSVSCPSLIPTRSWAAVVSKQSGSSTALTFPSSSVCKTAPPAKPQSPSHSTVANQKTTSTDKEHTDTSGASRLRHLGEQLARLSVTHRPVTFTPRGLINSGHLCYIHAPLQALISCPALYNLLHSLRTGNVTSSSSSSSSSSSTSTAVTDSLIQFVSQFPPCDGRECSSSEDAKTGRGGRKKKGKSDVVWGDPFKPSCVYNMLTRIKSGLSVMGRQEDAEEFLGCVLNRLHEELIAARRAVSSSEESEKTEEDEEERKSEEGKEEAEEEEEWQEVGPRNKSTITRRTAYSESLVSEIFGGKLQSSVTRQHKKESVTVQPFFSLQLDIQSDKVWKVSDALELLTQRQSVQLTADTDEVGYQKMALVHLPPILILHLKRFLFDSTGSQKIIKHISYEMTLEIPKDLLSSNVRGKFSHQQKRYQLWSVVYHHGRTAQGGHYTCDVYNPSSGGWLKMDDNFVKPIPDEAVLKQSSVPKVAYLLFYRRMDTILEHRKKD